MTEPDRSRRGGGQSSSKSKQHFEVAADEYQAPFQLPAKKSNTESTQEIDQADAAAFASSPYFDDQEAREAIEWARSQQEGEVDAGAEGVQIGRRRRRDSQVGSYDEGGSIFDGPGAGAVPSSVSSMRHEMARPELGRRSSRSSRRRISMEGRSPRRTRKLSSASAQSEAVTVSSERSVSPDSVAGRRKPASQRSGSTYHFGRRKRVPEDGDLTGSSQPKGMLGSILASIRGDRGDDDNDDARSRRLLLSTASLAKALVAVQPTSLLGLAGRMQAMRKTRTMTTAGDGATTTTALTMKTTTMAPTVPRTTTLPTAMESSHPHSAR